MRVLRDRIGAARRRTAVGWAITLIAFPVVPTEVGRCIRPETLRTNGKVWSSTNEFFAQCPAPIIGVTGTKGKGTTSSLITFILQAAGKTVHLVGNIGKPVLDVIDQIKPSDIVVFELSSFQLWDAERSPHVAVVLMIEPDHLDVHRDMAEYIAAKSNIAKHQHSEDSVIYHPLNQYAQAIAEQSIGHKYRYADSGPHEIYVRDDTFYRDDMPICSTSALQLRGGFNIENACAAIAAAAEFLDDLTAVDQGLRNFTGLPHRLRFVAERDGVGWFDDSIATTPGSAIAAMQSFREPKIIILGGSDKGASYNEVVAVAKQTHTRVIAIGETGARIATLCVEQGVEVAREEGLMPAVVATAYRLAHRGDVVILSPASASFDQYKSYSDRGDQFITAVKGLLV